jgi:hypothetical protein
MNSLNPRLSGKKLVFDVNHTNEEVERLIESEATK